MLNVRSKEEWIIKKKEDLKPYTSPDDSRLTWLEDAFLGYLAAWKDAVYQRPVFTKAEKYVMMLSQETQVGLRMRVLSFVAIEKEFCSIQSYKACIFSVNVSVKTPWRIFLDE